MSTSAQIEANRANAQKSTGPVTAEGKAASSKNSFKHGLTAGPEHRFNLSESDQADFDELCSGLRPQLQPKGLLEEKLFIAYCWAMYRSDLARNMEIWAEDQWMQDVENEANLRRYERMSKYRMMHERSASRARKELAEVQHDRFCANEANEVIKKLGFPDKSVSAVLPAAKIRCRDFRRCSGARLASQEILGYPDWSPSPSPSGSA